MKLSDISNIDFLAAIENVSELKRLSKYKDFRFVEQFIGLLTNRTYFYGRILDSEEIVPLKNFETEFNSADNITLLIEGAVNLPKTPVNNGEGSISYTGNGTLKVGDTIVFGGGGSSGLETIDFTESLIFQEGKDLYIYHNYVGDEGTISIGDILLQPNSGLSSITLVIEGNQVDTIDHSLPMPVGASFDETKINTWTAIYNPDFSGDTSLKNIMKVSFDNSQDSTVEAPVTFTKTAEVDFEGGVLENSVTEETLTSSGVTFDTTDAGDHAGSFSNAGGSYVDLDVTLAESYVKHAIIETTDLTSSNIASSDGNGTDHAFWFPTANDIGGGHAGDLSEVTDAEANMSGQSGVKTSVTLRYNHSDTTMHIYIDGSKVESGTITTGAATGAGVRLGQYQGVSSTRLNGLMYLFQLYSGTMTDEEVASLPQP